MSLNITWFLSNEHLTLVHNSKHVDFHGTTIQMRSWNLYIWQRPRKEAYTIVLSLYFFSAMPWHSLYCNLTTWDIVTAFALFLRYHFIRCNGIWGHILCISTKSDKRETRGPSPLASKDSRSLTIYNNLFMFLCPKESLYQIWKELER